MTRKANDWIEHPVFGVGCVSEDRGDRLDIDFINCGAKTILKTIDLKPAGPPAPNFKFPSEKSKARNTARFKVERPPRRPPLNFNHLVTCFTRCFPEGFEGQNFEDRERGYKECARNVLKDKLGKNSFEHLLRERHFAEIWEIAKTVLQSTNLAHHIEKAKFIDEQNVPYRERFAEVLFDLLYGCTEMEQRFKTFCDLLSQMSANIWTIATYYQFLASDGKWMFMKPSIMKRMAESLQISLNYKTEPNWLTYSKLQELADRVESELISRGLKPHSRIDVQGFIWASIWIEEGKYSISESLS
jgi:hypothetical protein